MKAELPLHVRVFDCDECPLVMDRDENAARNLAALAADCMTGTAVAGGRGTRVAKPRGADQKTRTTRQVLTGLAGRAGGANPTSGRKGKRETFIRTPRPNSGCGDTVKDLPGRKAGIAEI